jgi:Tfp pilus assembly protein PilE
MTLVELLILLVVAGVCSSLAQAIAGNSGRRSVGR